MDGDFTIRDPNAYNGDDPVIEPKLLSRVINSQRERRPSQLATHQEGRPSIVTGPPGAVVPAMAIAAASGGGISEPAKGIFNPSLQVGEKKRKSSIILQAAHLLGGLLGATQVEEIDLEGSGEALDLEGSGEALAGDRQHSLEPNARTKPRTSPARRNTAGSELRSKLGSSLPFMASSTPRVSSYGSMSALKTQKRRSKRKNSVATLARWKAKFKPVRGGITEKIRGGTYVFETGDAFSAAHSGVKWRRRGSRRHSTAPRLSSETEEFELAEKESRESLASRVVSSKH